jgi:Predicted membrane protein (DUF2214)
MAPGSFCKPAQFWLSEQRRLPGAICFFTRSRNAAQGDCFMAWPIIVAWIHYVAIMLMIASLLGEHLLLKREMSAAEAKTLQRLDIIYGGSAALVLITGILRMFLEKGRRLLQPPRRVSYPIRDLRRRGVALDLPHHGLLALAAGYKRRPRPAIGARSIRQAADDFAGRNDAVAAGAAVCDLDGARRILACGKVRPGPQKIVLKPDRHLRGFPIEPILLIGQRAPGIFHAFVAQIGRMIGRPLRQPLTILGIFAEMI